MSDRDSNITPPRSTTANGQRNVQQFDVTTSSVAKQLHEAMRMRWVNIKSTVDCTICFGPDNTVVVNRALTGDQGPTTQVGYPLTANVMETFELGGADNFLAVQGASAGQLVLLGSGSRPGGKETP